MTVKHIKDWSIQTKILAVSMAAMALLCLAFFIMFAVNARRKTLDATLAKARAICSTVESVRLEMEAKWEQGIFSAEQIREYARQGDTDRILATVPVVTAWKSAMREAEAEGYDFRVPKFEPRNPENAPDYGLDYDVEGPALRAMKKADMDEYHVIDPQRNAVRYFRAVRLSENCLLCHGDPKTSETLWGRADGRDPVGGRMENWKEGEVHGAFEVVQSLDVADKALRRDLIQAGLVALVLLFSTGVVFFLITRSMARPLRDGVAFARRLAEGDLTQTLKTRSQDEIGTLSEALNEMVRGLGRIITDVTRGFESLSSSSTELMTVSQQISQQTHKTRDMTTDVSHSAREMSEDMASVAMRMGETSAYVEQVASATEEMTATIGEIAQSTERTRRISEDGVNRAQSASSRVEQLEQAAQEIGKVTETIKEISEQTNLLALNANVEAARAGDAGRGFAVVAGEVKELSRQTTEAAKDIEARIKGIQLSTQDTIREIREITKVIRDINEFVSTIAAALEEQSITTKDIASNAVQSSRGIQSMDQAVSKTAAGVSHVADNMMDVTEASRDMAHGSQQVSQSAQELARLAEQLRDLVRRFRVTAIDDQP